MSNGDGDIRLAQMLKRCRAVRNRELLSSLAEAENALCRQRQSVASPWTTYCCGGGGGGSAGNDCPPVDDGDDLLLLDLYRSFPPSRPLSTTIDNPTTAAVNSFSVPLLMTRDPGLPLRFQRTLFEGEWVACFVIGGERRLCLTQLLHTRAFRHYSIVEINKACVHMNIQCSPCSKEQLNALKILTVLPITYASCSLITHTDAVRVYSFLCLQSKDLLLLDKWKFYKRDSRPTTTGEETSNNSSTFSIPVMHCCFGGCHGRFYVHLYTKPSAECIECEVCGDLFSVTVFVSHSHRGFERHVCHWGFDAANWRSYIHLPFQEATNNRYAYILKQFKSRFQTTARLETTDAKRPYNAVDFDRGARSKRPKFEIEDAASDPFDLTASDSILNLPTIMPSIYEAALLRNYSSTLLLNQNIIRSQPECGSGTARIPRLLNDHTGSDLNLTGNCLGDPKLPRSDTVYCNGLSKISEEEAAFNERKPFLEMKAELKYTASGKDSKAPFTKYFEEDTKTSLADDYVRKCAEESSIDALLKKYVTDPIGLRTIRTKIFDRLRDVETKRCYLEIQNRLLLDQLLKDERRRQFVAETVLPLSGIF